MLRLVVVFLFFAVVVTGQPNEATGTKNTKAPEKPTITTPDGPKADKTASHAAQKSNDSSPYWHTAFEWSGWLLGTIKNGLHDPNWWVVIIAAFTGAAIFRQAREMTKATNVMRDQGCMMKRQLEAMERETETSHRPWLSGDIVTDSYTGLAFDIREDVDDPGVSVDITAFITNSGETPAMNVTVSAVLALTQIPPEPVTNPHKGYWGEALLEHVVFPREEKPRPIKAFSRIPKDVIDAYMAGRTPTPQGVSMELHVFIDYRASFSPKDLNTTYRFMLTHGVKGGIFFAPSGTYHDIGLRECDRFFS